MPSVQKCADRLREQAYRTLTPQVQALEDELRNVGDLLAAGVRDLGYKIEALRNIELPVTEPVIDDYLRDAVWKRDLEGGLAARFIRRIRRHETQEEILASLLDGAANYFPKVALYTVRSGKFKGWSSRGFSDETARIISVDEFAQSDAPILLETLQSDDLVEIAELPEALNSIRDESLGLWRFFPVRVLEHPVALLVTSDEEGFASRPYALSVILDCAALRLENIALKIIRELGERDKTAALASPLVVAPPVDVLEPLVAQPDTPPPAVAPAIEPVSEIEEETPTPVETVAEGGIEAESALETGAIPLDLALVSPVDSTPEPPAEIPVAAEPLPVFAIDLSALTAPIDTPKPVSESVPEPESARPSPLSGLNLVAAPPVTSPVTSIDAVAPSTLPVEVPASPVTPVEVALKLVEEIVPPPEPFAPPASPISVVAESTPALVSGAVASVPEPIVPWAAPVPPVPVELAVADAPVVEPEVKQTEEQPVAPIPLAAPVVSEVVEAVEVAPSPTDATSEQETLPKRRRTDATLPLPLTGPEEEKLHSAAKRFAKLLVSEIKLYNENTVAEGRKNRDIYIRLHRDIDRSRDMYEKRVAPTVASKIDYFHDEIICILGDNDARTLGDGYPGPRIG